MPSKSLFVLPDIPICVCPCPCGYFDNPIKPCTCSPPIVTKYQKRISGLLLDRIDTHVEVPRVDYQKLCSDRLGETSDVIRSRVQAARDCRPCPQRANQSPHLAEALQYQPKIIM